MKRKPILNETLFIKQVSNRQGEEPLAPVVVSKVGRKYFTCKMDWREIQFHLHSWRQVTEYNPDYILYESEQEHSDLRERERLIATLRQAFNHWGQSPYSLETLRQIKEIIDNAKTK